MSLRSSTWPTATNASEEDCGHQEVSTTALDFFLALSRLDSEEIWRVGMSLGSGRRAGQGAFAFAVICEMESKQLVAVKRSLKLHGSLWVYQEQEFARHFKEFCLELRILLHDSLRSHENIINLRGIYEQDVSGVPSLSLVLENGDRGTLDCFLKNDPDLVRFGTQDWLGFVLECIFQLASGYETLHSLGICHGDVKTTNVLVVLNESRWVYKICDFGQAVVSSKIGDGSVQLPHGTAIYNAPEIRNLDGSATSSFTIADALLTDLYSFGLLVWEVLVQGEVYYKTIETHDLATPTSANIHEFLRNVPQNELLQYAFSAMDTQNFPKSFKNLFGFVVQGTLQYHPKDRTNMGAIKRVLGRNDDGLQPLSFVHDSRAQSFTPSTAQVKQDVEHQEDTGNDTILSWTGELSLFQVTFSSFGAKYNY
jgi:serine/threonine protein kinase